MWKTKTKSLSIKSWRDKNPLILNGKTLENKKLSKNKGEKEHSLMLRTFSCNNQEDTNNKRPVMRTYSHDTKKTMRLHGSQKKSKIDPNEAKNTRRKFSHNVNFRNYTDFKTTLSQEGNQRNKLGKQIKTTRKRWEI